MNVWIPLWEVVSFSVYKLCWLFCVILVGLWYSIIQSHINNNIGIAGTVFCEINISWKKGGREIILDNINRPDPISWMQLRFPWGRRNSASGLKLQFLSQSQPARLQISNLSSQPPKTHKPSTYSKSLYIGRIYYILIYCTPYYIYYNGNIYVWMYVICGWIYIHKYLSSFSLVWSGPNIHSHYSRHITFSLPVCPYDLMVSSL